MSVYGDFEYYLERHKEAPRRESAAMLLADAKLLAYVVIWKQVPPTRKRDELGSLMEPAEDTWPALWECVDIDYAAMALLADDELVKARKMVERLKGLRLVYPDGMVQELANKIITKSSRSASWKR